MGKGKNITGLTVRGLDTAERARAREQEDICEHCGTTKVLVMSDNLDSMEQVFRCPKCETKPSGIF